MREMIIAASLHMLLWGCILFPFQQPLGPGAIRSIFLLLGFTNTSFILAWSVAKELTSEKYTGLAISVLNAAGFLAIAVATSLMGILIDFFSSYPIESAYRSAFFIGFVSSALALLFAFFGPETGSVRVRKNK